MVPITVDLTSEQADSLTRLAESLQLEPQDLVRQAIEAMLAQPNQDFAEAAAFVLGKNRELYERLS